MTGLTGSNKKCQYDVFGVGELVPSGQVLETEVEVAIAIGSVSGNKGGKFTADETIYVRVNAKGVFRVSFSLPA